MERNIFIEMKTLTATNMKLIQAEQFGFYSRECRIFSLRSLLLAVSLNALAESISEPLLDYSISHYELRCLITNYRPNYEFPISRLSAFLANNDYIILHLS